MVLLTPKRFAAVPLNVGKHTFSASQSKKHPNEKEVVTVDLEAGKQYFFEVTTTITGFNVVSVMRSHIAAVSCAEFNEDATHDGAKPVEDKRMSKMYQDKVLRDAAVPPCQN